MFNNLKLQKRILLGYAIPIFGLIGTIIFGWWTSSRVFEGFEEVHKVEDILEKSKNIDRGIRDIISSSKSYMINPNQEFLQQYQEAKQLFNQGIEELNQENLIQGSQERERLNRIIQLTEEYQNNADSILSLIQEGKRAEAINLFTDQSNLELIRNLNQVHLEFDLSELEILQEKNQESERFVSFMVFTLVIIVIIISLLSIALAYWISSGVGKTINETSHIIQSSSSEIAATLQQQEYTATQQATSVNETTTTMDELNVSARQSIKQAEAAASSAQEALVMAQAGNLAAEKAFDQMSDLKEKVEEIANKISDLRDQTSEIGNISQLVGDLSNRTNMLALNAAVEAVRAGEHGKGFSVVASEIRKLADRSKQSANKISDLVSQIQTSIGSTVMVTDEGTTKVKTSLRVTENTLTAFTGVTDAVNDVVINNQQISLNIKQQATAFEQVLNAMNAINQGAQETSVGINQTKEGTKKLDSATKNLQSLV